MMHLTQFCDFEILQHFLEDKIVHGWRLLELLKDLHRNALGDRRALCNVVNGLIMYGPVVCDKKQMGGECISCLLPLPTSYFPPDHCLGPGIKKFCFQMFLTKSIYPKMGFLKTFDQRQQIVKQPNSTRVRLSKCVRVASVGLCKDDINCNSMSASFLTSTLYSTKFTTGKDAPSVIFYQTTLVGVGDVHFS